MVRHPSEKKNQFWISKGLVLGTALFLGYINDLPNSIISTYKIFDNDNLLFFGVHKFVNELSSDFEKIDQQPYQWKMQFNPDPNKEANKVTFPWKSNQISFSIPLLNSIIQILLNVPIKNILELCYV